MWTTASANCAPPGTNSVLNSTGDTSEQETTPVLVRDFPLLEPSTGGARLHAKHTVFEHLHPARRPF